LINAINRLIPLENIASTKMNRPSGHKNSPVKISDPPEKVHRMANDPKAAREMRDAPEKRQNAQGDHEGSAHSPDEFKVTKQNKPGTGEGKPSRRPEAPSDDR